MGFDKTGSPATWWALKVLGFLAGSFVFSWIFWMTKKWLDKKPKKRRRR